MADCSSHPHMAEGERGSKLLTLLLRAPTSLSHEGCTLTTSFHPNHFPKASKPITLAVRGGHKYSVHGIPHREHLGMGFNVRFLLSGVGIPGALCVVLMTRLHPRQRSSGSLRVRAQHQYCAKLPGRVEEPCVTGVACHCVSSKAWVLVFPETRSCATCVTLACLLHGDYSIRSQGADF